MIAAVPVAYTGAKKMGRSMDQSQQYYRVQSNHTDPGKSVALYEDLPPGAAPLCELVQGLLIHGIHGARYGIKIRAEKLGNLFVPDAATLLEAIINGDPRPLHEPRDPEERFAGSCRHYAGLLCSMLRYQGVPSRLRNGFSTYLHMGKFSDHWVCEYWDAMQGRWVMVDAFLDDVQRKSLRVTFDHRDVSPEDQIPAGIVWRRCREGAMDPMLCGSMNIWGMDYVKGNLVRDFAALNRNEMLPWDGSDLTEKPYDQLAEDELAFLDHLAELTSPAVQFPEVKDTYDSHPELHVRTLPCKFQVPNA